MPDPDSPYVKDPRRPAGAELADAVQRGLANGTIITIEQFLASAGSLEPGPETSREAEAGP